MHVSSALIHGHRAPATSEEELITPALREDCADVAPRRGPQNDATAAEELYSIIAGRCT